MSFAIRRTLPFALLFVALVCVLRAPAWIFRPRADATSIEIYTTSWCQYCAGLRRHLGAHGIPYREWDVEQSFRGAIGHFALGGRGVPVVVIGPKIVYGYDEPKIDAALEDLGYRMDSRE